MLGVQHKNIYVTIVKLDHAFIAFSGVITMGSDRANRGAPNPNGPNGGPQAKAVEQKHWPGRPLIYYNVVF